jgi:hypothetical protein
VEGATMSASAVALKKSAAAAASASSDVDGAAVGGHGEDGEAMDVDQTVLEVWRYCTRTCASALAVHRPSALSLSPQSFTNDLPPCTHIRTHTHARATDSHVVPPPALRPVLVVSHVTPMLICNARIDIGSLTHTHTHTHTRARGSDQR